MTDTGKDKFSPAAILTVSGGGRTAKTGPVVPPLASVEAFKGQGPGSPKPASGDPCLDDLRREVHALRREVLALADLVSANACDPDTSRALADLAERCQRRAAND